MSVGRVSQIIFRIPPPATPCELAKQLAIDIRNISLDATLSDKKARRIIRKKTLELIEQQALCNEAQKP